MADTKPLPRVGATQGMTPGILAHHTRKMRAHMMTEMFETNPPRSFGQMQIRLLPLLAYTSEKMERAFLTAKAARALVMPNDGEGIHATRRIHRRLDTTPIPLAELEQQTQEQTQETAPPAQQTEWLQQRMTRVV